MDGSDPPPKSGFDSVAERIAAKVEEERKNVDEAQKPWRKMKKMENGKRKQGEGTRDKKKRKPLQCVLM